MIRILPFSLKYFYLLCACLLLGIGVVQPLQAQNSSNKGRDFWVAYTGHIDGLNSRMFLYLTSDVTTTATVTIGVGAPRSYPVNANAVTVVPIEGSQAYIAGSEVIERKGIHVTAVQPIVVYSHIFRSARSAATLVLPTATMGREYYTLNYEQSLPANNEPERYSQFTIIATEDNTTVEVTPTQSTRAGRAANSPFKVKLNAGEIYQVQSLIDLTGSRITTNVPENITCKKVAVFSGSTWTAFGCFGASGGDNLYQQLYPLSSWGKNFVTAPFIQRPFDIFRIIVGEDNTTVQVNGSAVSANGTPLNNPYRKGAMIEFQSDRSNVITADKGISVAQFQIAQTCDFRNSGRGTNNPLFPGDPDMVVLNPVEQTVTSTTLYSALQNQTNPATNITQHYINVVMKTAEINSFRINGNRPTANFVPIPNSEYSYLQEDVSLISNGQPTHNLTADAGFNAIAYGYGAVESYAYSAGANVKDLSKNITANTNTGTDSGCLGKVLDFTGNFPYAPLKIVWDFGDGSPVYEEKDLTKIVQVSPTAYTIKSPEYTYSQAGTFTVKLMITRSSDVDCDAQDEITYDFTVNPNPVAAFNFSVPCYRDSTAFTDASNVSQNNAIKKWSWDFGDVGSGRNNISDKQNPKHLFSAPGTYRVKLMVTNNGGCIDTLSQRVIIYPKPVPVFASVPVCEGNASVFTDQSTTAVGTINRWEWTFGDGSTSTEQNPSHQFSQAGRYRVRLKVFSDISCSDTLSKVIIIFPKPQAAFTLPDACVRDVITFTNNSAVPGGGALTYLWSFGDGATSTDQNPSHRYATAGNYPVQLTVTTANGCQDVLAQTFMVSAAEPRPDFTFRDLCQKDTVKFTDATTIAFGKIIRWEWNFGDGTTSTEQHPKHLYSQAGNYVVRLVAYSGQTCQETITKTITVIPSPTAAFTTVNVCVGENITLNEASSIPGGTIANYTWNFGDGATATGRQPVYQYKAPGTFTISLTVTGANGCIDRLTRQIVVSPKPIATFNAVNLCEKEAVAFTDASTVSSGRITTWQWDFGDGSTATQQNPSYTYRSSGNYAVKLTVTSEAGCQDVITRTITISAQPQALAGPDQVNVCGVTSTALAAQIPTVGTGTWTVVSGAGGNFSNPDLPNARFTGRYNELYTLRWTVRNAPCPDATDDVQIKFNPTPAVAAGPDIEIIEGESYTLKATGEGSFLWSPATGLSNATVANPVASPLETITYTLTVTSAAGCTNTDALTIRVLPRLKIPNAFSPNEDGVNDAWVIQNIQEYQQVTIEIFDRWGSKVYEGGNTTAWTGMRNGKSLPMATYYYIISPHNGHKPITGHVSIVK